MKTPVKTAAERLNNERTGPPVIRIDRPFAFALRENLSGTILFMGVIRHPASE